MGITKIGVEVAHPRKRYLHPFIEEIEGMRFHRNDLSRTKFQILVIVRIGQHALRIVPIPRQIRILRDTEHGNREFPNENIAHIPIILQSILILRVDTLLIEVLQENVPRLRRQSLDIRVGTLLVVTNSVKEGQNVGAQIIGYLNVPINRNDLHITIVFMHVVFHQKISGRFPPITENFVHKTIDGQCCIQLFHFDLLSDLPC